MKHMIKRVCATLLTFALILGMVSMGVPTASAAGTENIEIRAQNIKEDRDGPNWSWRWETRTLTLTDFSYEGDLPGIDLYIMTMSEVTQINIVLKGENTVRNNSTTSNGPAVSITATSARVVISGDGSLTATKEYKETAGGFAISCKEFHIQDASLIGHALKYSSITASGALTIQNAYLEGTTAAPTGMTTGLSLYTTGPFQMSSGTVVGASTSNNSRGTGVTITSWTLPGEIKGGTIKGKAPLAEAAITLKNITLAPGMTVTNGAATPEGTGVIYKPISSSENGGYVTIASGFAITYDTDGGDVLPPDAGKNALPDPLPTPTKTGHQFGGWYTDSTLTSTAVAGEIITSNTVLYAKWTVNDYHLTVKGGGGITSVSASVDGAALPLGADGKTVVPYGKTVTLGAEVEADSRFFLWDNSGADVGTDKNQSVNEQHTFTMPVAEESDPVVFTASTLSGVSAMGTLTVEPSALKPACATTVTLTKDGNAYSDFAGAVTLRDADSVIHTLTGTGDTRTGSLPQDGKTYAVWVDAADSGKVVTLSGTTAAATVPYQTYAVAATKDSVADYNPGVVTIEYPKGSGNFVANGAVLPTGEYDVYVEADKVGTTAGLVYFTATFNDGVTDYASSTPWAPQVVLQGGYATAPTADPSNVRQSFVGWDKRVADTAINAPTTFTAQWENYADCEAKWVIAGETFYGTLKQGLDATDAASGGYIEMQLDVSLTESGELHPDAMLNIPASITLATGGNLTTKGAVKNAGTINGGLTNSGNITNSGTIAALTNSGNITNSGTITTLSNSGTVTGGTVGTLDANTGTVKASSVTTVVSNIGGTLDNCTISGGANIGGTLKGYTYAGNGVVFSGVDASAATVSIQGGTGSFAGLQTADNKLGSNLVVREPITTSGILDLNSYSIRGADGADNANGVTAIKTAGNLTIVGPGSIYGGAGGSSNGAAAGSGGHGIDATGDFDLVLGETANVTGGQGGSGAGSNNGGNGGCGIHGSSHGGAANTSPITVSGSAQGGSGGPGVGTGSAGGNGGYAVCGDIILDGGGSMQSGNGGDGRADDPTDESTIGTENTTDIPNVSGTLKYGVVKNLSYLDSAGDAFADGNADFALTLSAKNSNQYLTLPDSITVTVGGTALVAGTGYTYNKNTGAVIVNNPITAVIGLTAVGKVAETAVVTADAQLEDALEAPVKSIMVDGDISMGANGELFEGGVLTIGAGKTLTLNSKTLTNKGVIIVNGTLVGTVTNADLGLVLSLPAATAAAPFDKLAGLKANMTYTIEGKHYTADDSGAIPIPDAWCGKSISLAQVGRGHTGPTQTLDLTAVMRAEAPAAADFAVKQPAAATGAGSTGSVAFATGKGGSYEYSTDGGKTFTPMPALPGSVDNLPQGTEVLIRISADGSTPASKSLTIQISTYSSDSGSDEGNQPSKPEDKPDGTLPENGMTTETVTKPDGSKEDHVTVDGGTLDQIVKDSNKGSTVVIPVKKPDGGSVSVTIPGGSMNGMADKDMSATVDTGNIKVELPASSLSGKSDVTVTITSPTAQQSDSIKEKVEAVGSQVVVIPDQVIITEGGFTADAFVGYVSRTFEITAEQAAKITTAVAPRENGTLRHLPTYVFEDGGKYYAKVNALVNEPVSMLIFNEQSFRDTQDKWYEAAAHEMAARKIVTGTTVDTFNGERSITRAEFAVIVVRALGLPDSGTAEQFGDVNADDWYAGAIDAANRYGIVRGKTEVQFDPNANITRQEAMVILARAAALIRFTAEGGDLSQFSDASTVDGWAADGVAFSVGAGLIMGSNGELRLGDDISRAESATVILRILQKAHLVDVRTGN